jgi:hypothetical protein
MFEWSRSLGRILDAGNEVNVFAIARRGLLLSGRSLVRADIDSSSVEMTREVSRAYMGSIQANR